MIRSTYWSCTPFAKWVLGAQKPNAESAQGWNDWEEKMKSERPVRYWISQELLNHIQNVVMWPADRIKSLDYYISNRWISRSHALTAFPENIRPGQWCDLSDRILYCMFDELVKYVEIEQAWMMVSFDEDKRKEYGVPSWRMLRRLWRSEAAGREYLAWATELRNDEDMGYDPDDEDYGKLTRQAEAAREVLALYEWWTVTRPARPDPYDEAGWTEFYESRKNKEGGLWLGLANRSEEDREESRRIFGRVHELEEQHQIEDDQMLNRLVAVRHSLWT
jgi:hypothetical protein